MDIADKLGLYNDDFHNEQLDIYKSALASGVKIINYNRQSGVANVEIEDRPYKFLVGDNFRTRYDFCKDLNSYRGWVHQMIDNIRRAGTVKSIEQVGYKDVVISNLLDRTPDVKRDEVLVRNGNAETGEYDIYESWDIFESKMHKEINPAEIKTIKYLIKPDEGYDNNYLANAYSYYDQKCDKLYLYKPEEKVIQVLNGNSFVKNFVISDSLN